MAQIQYFIHGGKVNLGTLKNIFTNGYAKKKNNNVDGYELDHSLSGQRVGVYHNPETNHTIVSHKGTDSATD